MHGTVTMASGLKLKVRKFWGLNPMFAVTGEKLVRERGFESKLYEKSNFQKTL